MGNHPTGVRVDDTGLWDDSADLGNHQTGMSGDRTGLLGDKKKFPLLIARLRPENLLVMIFPNLMACEMHF